ncbi:MAG: hypothetical protein EG823_01655 [Actinobacteria bacterium]|nr:hypothetical protein [Actinomycetota bacterium]
MPTKVITLRKGFSMKKTAFVLLLALALVAAFAAVAYASTESNQIAWSSASPNNNTTPPTPHTGYLLNTQKCLVCHAVHKSSTAGEVLLDDTVANACVFCHVSASGVASVHVYYNDTTNYYVTSSDVSNKAHNVGCTDCHAVHGANTIQQTSLRGYILRSNADLASSPVGAQSISNADYNMTSGSAAGAETAFCAQCHAYFTDTYALTTSSGDITYNSATYNSHVMTSDYTSYGPGAAGSGAIGKQVAWASSAYCTSCHDAGAAVVTNTGVDSFPHYTVGARFMKSATDYASIGSAVAATYDHEDGVCLKCHASTATGVSMSY